MNKLPKLPFAFLVIAIPLGLPNISSLTAQVFNKEFKYAPAAVDNPLKGLVPYHGQGGKMPHSLEFWYFPLADLMTGPNQFDWTSVEARLKSAQQRGNQMVLRVYLEYPNKPSGVPAYLLNSGLKMVKYQHGNDRCETPDYSNPKLIEAVVQFIDAFGKKYDGDPRIGFLTMGIVGQWGEWHTYPRNDLFPSKQTQSDIMSAFQRAFQTTKVLMRYPAGADDWQKAKNSHLPFGYHDDSFAWATLDTGQKGDEWFYLSLLKNAGKEAEEKWQSEPIGGEIRPEIWGCVFDDPSCAREGQAFDQCIKQTHVTWLMDTSFPPDSNQPNEAQRIEVAKRHVQTMGYEFHVSAAEFTDQNNQLHLKVTIENRGVAPFYYRWPIQLLVQSDRGSESIKTDWDLRQIAAGGRKIFALRLPPNASKQLKLQTSRLAIRIVNPMKGGKPVQWANQTQKDGVLFLTAD